ncbi:hypothetical protein FHT00_001233 [Sphingomonas insulae]|uniref:Uncharacterized protein n=1 Tax=Sphingomonas insulae TaxID=424800 RepID=A0ABN1HRI4_9SPHN|nr:hypothetical protein [Sphingomonas insulae]NIJ29300.1 hypothetical protein [Sphingomonas insulae]
MTKMPSLVTSPQRVKLCVDDYLRLDAAGAFDTYGKTELLDGDVVYIDAQYRPPCADHVATVPADIARIDRYQQPAGGIGRRIGIDAAAHRYRTGYRGDRRTGR